MVVFDQSMGNAGYVSHQWLAERHPDPELRQMEVLQDALRHILRKQGSVSLDAITEAVVPGAKPLQFQELQSRPLFLWYDYFSVPQQCLHNGGTTCRGLDTDQAKAITSFPAYVAECRYFFALCPTVDCPSQGKVLNTCTWARRAWASNLGSQASYLGCSVAYFLTIFKASITLPFKFCYFPAGY